MATLQSIPACAPRPAPTEPLPGSVAIVGVGCVLPKAPDARRFWENVRAKVDAIRELPAGRWPAEVFYDPDPKAPDKTYAKVGGFVEEIPFDPRRFRIPPAMAKYVDDAQRMALVAAAEALADAGLDRKPFDRARTAVVVGASGGGDRKADGYLRLIHHWFESWLLASPSFAALPVATREAAIGEVRGILDRETLPITEDTLPGFMPNLAAGRVAAAFDLHGPNCVVDAACASSLAALDLVTKGLRDGEHDVALCGGADQTMYPDTYVYFSKIGALSPDRPRPFDAKANGMVMGEGAGMLVLKRVEDAMRDGDAIYAVVRAVAGGSDGRGRGITAPNADGQELTMRRAYEAAGISPALVGLVECHGTGTPVGDATEIESLARVFVPAGAAPGSVAIGSVKSQIGHLKPAAGVASLVKVAFALRDKVLPPSNNFETPNSAIAWDRTPFYVNTEARPWPERGDGEPRRAAVSGFGFGGTNYHVVLEEFVPAYHGRLLSRPRAPAATEVARPTAPAAAASTSAAAPPAGGALRDEVAFLSGADAEALLGALAAAVQHLRAGASVAQVAASARASARADAPVRLGVVIPGALAEAAARLEEVAALLRDPGRRGALAAKGAFHREGAVAAGKIAFLFPGQGSQHAQMGRDLAERYPAFRAAFEEAEARFEPLLGFRLRDVMFPDPADPVAVSAAEERLAQTQVTQPAVFAHDVAMLRLLASWGLSPGAAAGHSLGEAAALVAAGSAEFGDVADVVGARGLGMAALDLPDKGRMASVAAPLELVEKVVAAASADGRVAVANVNGPTQVVIGGTTPGVESAVRRFESLGVDVRPLRVSHAFHTELVAPAAAALEPALARVRLRPPRFPVVANATAEPYPADPAAMRSILLAQVASRVRWKECIERLHADGVRVFVEVGPRRVLTGTVADTLRGKEFVAIPTSHPRRGGVGGVLEAAAQLFSLGIPLAIPGDAPAAAPAPPPAPIDPAAEAGGAPLRSGAPDPAAPAAAPATAAAALRAAAAEMMRAAAQMMVAGARMMEGDGAIAPTLPSAAPPTRADAVPVSAPVPAPAAPPPPLAPAPGTSPHATAVLERLRSIAAERTGYPVETLEPDVHLEADLGIDTVKQLEIFAALRESYGLAKEPGLKMRQLPTLRHVAEHVARRLGDSGEASTVQAAAPAPAPAAPAGRALRRLVPSWEALPAPSASAGGALPGPAFLVAAGARAEETRAACAAAGLAITEAPAQARTLLAVPGPDEVSLLALFDAARASGPGLRVGGVVAILAPDGPWGGAFSGFAKSLDREWTETRRVVCVRGSGPADLLDEARRPGPAEVVLAGGERLGAVYHETAPPAAATSSPRPGDVVVLTGGASGITAACAVGLAGAVPGLSFVLLGRTALPPDADRLATRTEAEWEAAKDAARAALAARGERPTPVAVERALAADRRTAEAARTLAALRDGAAREVRYVAGDVADPAVAERLLEAARGLGRVALVVHGAGTEDSRPIEEKDPATFRRVFATKALGASNLVEAARADRPAFLFFGSVAGRFGNPGQTDYAAGNDFLAKLCERLRAEGLFARTLSWTAWGETGMVPRNRIRHLLEAGGIDLIPTSAGVAAFVAEALGDDGATEAVLSRGLGDLDPTPAREEPWRLTADLPFLNEHRFGDDRVPYLPAVVALERFVEVAAAALAKRTANARPVPPLSEVRDLRWITPVKLHRDEPVEATVRARQMREGVPDVEVTLETLPPGPAGVAREPRVHARAVVSFGPREPAPAASPAIAPAAAGPWPMQAKDLYGPFLRHGPSMQGLDRVAGVALDAIAADLRPFGGLRDEPGRTDPLAIEGAFQACGLWAGAIDGYACLPASLLLVRWFEGAGRAVRVAARACAGSPEGRTFDVDLVDAQGRVAIRLESFAMARAESVAGSPLLGTDPLNVSWARLGGRDVARVRPAEAGGDRALALLSSMEAAHAATLDHPKRRRDWVGATLAAKAAVQRLLPARAAWTAIEILPDPEGGRRVLLHGEPCAFRVSVTHAPGWSAAVAWEGGGIRLGLDAEAVEERPPAFLEEAFAASERSRFTGDPRAATRAWCVKEAFAKALGIGFANDLHDVEVTLRDDAADVDARGAWKEAWTRAGRERLEAATASWGDHEAALVEVGSRGAPGGGPR